MKFTDCPPVVNQLPERPIRIAGGQSIRRVTTILLLSPFVVTGIHCLVVVLLPATEQTPHTAITVLGITLLIFWTMAAAFFAGVYRIEVCRQGIRTIGLWYRSTLFRWEDFRQRRVSEGPTTSSWLRNVLPEQSADKLKCNDTAPAAERWLHQLIHQVWVRPAAPPAPQVLLAVGDLFFVGDHNGLMNCQCGPLEHWLLPRKLRSARLRLERGNPTDWNRLSKQLSGARIPWDHIMHVEVWQLEHGRYDFEQLQLTWQNPSDPENAETGTWYSRPRNDQPRFQGMPAHEFLAFVLQNVDHSRVGRLAYTGLPLTQYEWNRRHERFVAPLRRFVHEVHLMLLILGGVAVLSIVVSELQSIIRLSCIVLATLLAGTWLLFRGQLRKLERQYEHWQEQIPPA